MRTAQNVPQPRSGSGSSGNVICILDVVNKFARSRACCSLNTAGPLIIKGLLTGGKKLNDRQLLTYGDYHIGA